MKPIANTFIQGLAFTLPLVITFGLVYWLFSQSEALLKIPLQYILPEGWYVTGMGVASAFVIIFLIGILVQAYVIKYVLHLLVKLVESIPLVNTLYNSARDLTQLFTKDSKSELNRVVVVEITEGVRLMGFVTNDDVNLDSSDELLAVYFPMSYQMGGYLAYINKERCESVDIPVQKAMQQILTAHIKRPGPTK